MRKRESGRVGVRQVRERQRERVSEKSGWLNLKPY